VNRTGSLPVSYFPDSSEVNQNLGRYEEGAYQYFSTLNDPNLVRVGQYTFLYQIFCTFNITAPANELNQIQEAKDVLMEPTIALFRKIIINRNEMTKVGLMPGPNALGGFELNTDLKTYYRNYGEAGLKEIANFANDRDALFKIDRKYFQIVKLFHEHERLTNQHNKYVDSCNVLVPRHNDLGQNLHRTSAQEMERQALDTRIRGYKMLAAPIKVELTRIKSEIDRLTIATDERLELRTKILQRISLAKELVYWDLELRDSIKEQYALAHGSVNNTTWIKTPSIVISQDTLNVSMVGGHNINAAVDHFVLDATVPRGSISDVTVNGKRVLKINPADAGRVNSSFLKDLRYTSNHVTTANATRNLQRNFANNPPPPTRTVNEVFDLAEPGGDYDPKHGIGWAYKEGTPASNTLMISKTEEGYFTINNKKTTTTYNLREAIEDHLKNQPDAMGMVEFANFTDVEVRYFTENIASRFNNGNKAQIRWNLFRGKKEAITARDYDFNNKSIQQLDNGNIRISIPKKETNTNIFINLVGVAENMFQTAKAKIEKVLNMGKAQPASDIVPNLMSEFKAAGIPLNKVIVSGDDWTISIIITCSEEDNS
jgi:hypothetical protein